MNQPTVAIVWHREQLWNQSNVRHKFDSSPRFDPCVSPSSPNPILSRQAGTTCTNGPSSVWDKGINQGCWSRVPRHRAHLTTSACFPFRVGKALLHTLTLPLVHHFSFIFRRSENRNQAPDPRVSGIAELVHFSYTCVSNTRKAESESCNRLLLNTRCGTSWVQTNLL